MAQPHLHKTSEASSRVSRPHSLPFLLFLVINTILISHSFLLPTHAAIYEVNVVKPTPKADTTVPKKGSILSPGGDKLFSSKYLGTSVVSNARNLGYSGTIILGDNPPQEFEVVFDTGSDMIVVTSDQCQGTHCNDMAHYKCVTCQKTPYSYNITYGDGTWGNGPIVTDTVSIGGLVVKDQQILDIVQSGLDLSSYGSGISGLVGLMPSSPVMNAIPPLATIFKDKLLDMNVFSVYLAPSLKTRQGGSFLFGGIDRTKFVGELNQVPLSTAPGVREGMWYIDADGAFIGSTPVSGYKTSPWLFDTGTSFIAVPTSFAAAFHENIPGSSFSDVDKIYSVPCTGNWTFGVSFNGTKYEIPYLDYIAFADKAAKLCVSLVMPLGDYEMFILGDPFLRQVYAVYDFTPGASRIGLAAVNVTNNFLGNEGLSGDPVPGGSVIGGKQVSGAAASLLSSMFRTTTTNMAVALCVVAAMMAMSV